MYPLNSKYNIIVVGGNAAGPAAAAKAKRTAPESNVTMIEAGESISTGTCELPYVLSGEIKDHNKIVYYVPESFEKEKGVKVLVRHIVEKIDRRKKKVSVKSLQDGQKFELNYDSLILCTGSKAKSLPSLSTSLSNSFTLKTIRDLIDIQNFISEKKPQKALIIGAGYIGLETADALVSLGLEISLLEKEPAPLPGAEEETRRLILELLKEKDVNFIGGITNPVFKDDGRNFLSLKYEGRVIPYDLVITAVGFEPNSSLAFSSKLGVGKSGGIIVDQKLKTSDPNIYSAGDCIEVINRITGRPEYIPLATIARYSGHLAGENAAGGNSFMTPVIKNVALKIFNKSFVQVGLNSNEAAGAGFNASSVAAVAPNLVKVMPGAQNTFGKILFDRDSKYILGANFLGGNEVIGYGDLISVFIKNRIKISELININMNYTPPLSPFINILSILGRKIGR